MFIDRVEIFVKAGDGGDGCNSFYRDRYMRYKKPDGGPGGRGGDIILRADPNIHTLLDFYYKRHFNAGDGENGSSNHKKGKKGEDCLIRVPIGTLVFDKEEGFRYCDLKESFQEILLLKGAEGGRGNSRLRPAEKGKRSEGQEIVLELKLIADVGVIGFPNAGKSSLVWKVSNARPKIADYPFTTKTPTLGVVRMEGDRDFVICDIPGLIEGAHKGKGLGDKFLRHIERTIVLVHLIDMAAVDGKDPVYCYRTILKELESYGANLLKKPQVLAANKMDLEPVKANLKAFRKKIRKKIYPISCITGEGLEELKEVIWKTILDTRRVSKG